MGFIWLIGTAEVDRTASRANSPSLILTEPVKMRTGFVASRVAYFFPWGTCARILNRLLRIGANGNTFVLTSIIAVHIAMLFGIFRLFLAGAFAHLVADDVLEDRVKFHAEEWTG